MASSPSSTIHPQIIKKLFKEDNSIFQFSEYLFFSEDEEALSGQSDFLFKTAIKELSNSLTQLADSIKLIEDCALRFCLHFLAKTGNLSPRSSIQSSRSFYLAPKKRRNWRPTSVSRFATLLFPTNNWPELLESMLKWLSSPDSGWASILLMNDLIPTFTHLFIPNVDTMKTSFQQLMEQGYVDYRIKTTTVCASAKLIPYLVYPPDYNEYYGLLTEMIRVLRDAADNNDQDFACIALDE